MRNRASSMLHTVYTNSKSTLGITCIQTEDTANPGHKAFIPIKEKKYENSNISQQLNYLFGNQLVLSGTTKEQNMWSRGNMDLT